MVRRGEGEWGRGKRKGGIGGGKGGGARKGDGDGQEEGNGGEEAQGAGTGRQPSASCFCLPVYIGLQAQSPAHNTSLFAFPISIRPCPSRISANIVRIIIPFSPLSPAPLPSTPAELPITPCTHALPLWSRVVARRMLRCRSERRGVALP